jgi:hypothetical protein
VSGSGQHERHNRAFWDADADDYQALHGGDLTTRALAWASVAHPRVGVVRPG